ncbi:MAG: hypothetical protein IJL87_02390 [Clostridia bacterium]|nr:hypothetical protein [Clostridia bacterium]
MKKKDNGGDILITIEAIAVTVLGLLGSGAVAMALDIDSGFLMVVMWFVFSLVLLFLFEFIKSQF